MQQQSAEIVLHVTHVKQPTSEDCFGTNNVKKELDDLYCIVFNLEKYFDFVCETIFSAQSTVFIFFVIFLCKVL